MVALLMAHGADALLPHHQPGTLMQYFARVGAHLQLSILLERGADPEVLHEHALDIDKPESVEDVLGAGWERRIKRR